MSGAEELATFLAAAGLSQFLKTFTDAGHNTVDILTALSPEALEEMGFKKGHVKKLKRALEDFETTKAAKAVEAQHNTAQAAKDALAAASAGSELTSEQVHVDTPCRMCGLGRIFRNPHGYMCWLQVHTTFAKTTACPYRRL